MYYIVTYWCYCEGIGISEVTSYTAANELIVKSPKKNKSAIRDKKNGEQRLLLCDRCGFLRDGLIGKGVNP